ncbi:hypothetical protein DPX39_070082000 [Trypanosoma brucei equiperdum]|uniref:Transmembrane protein n=1 Tax=Trypanosoma brucei equiperdum TaxID=630700 RepID=A0A3L6L4E8_9TRYP|nr:hypothetical protein DPX39_070082000 [Trypanosoma brucei equiperdum]
MYPQQQMSPPGNMQQWNAANSGYSMPYARPYSGYSNGTPPQQPQQPQQQMHTQMLPDAQMQQIPQQQMQQQRQQQMQMQQAPPQQFQQQQMQGDSNGQQPMWGYPPPNYQGYRGNPNMYDRRYSEAAAVPGCCNYERPGAASSGCCCTATEGTNPYCCGPPTEPGGPLNCCASMCDRTFVAMVFFFLLSTSAFATIMSLGDKDNILVKFKVPNTRALQAKINSNIVSSSGGCTDGFFTDSRLCMGDGIDAFALTVQLKTWSTQRNAMYFLAMIYSLFTLLYAYLINFHRRSNRGANDENDPLASSQHQHGGHQGSAVGYPSVKGQLDATINDSQQGSQNTQMQPGLQMSPRTGAADPIQVYGIPFYETMRCAWFVMGFAVVTWTYTLMASYMAQSQQYRDRASGELQQFLTAFHQRFIATVVCVTIYLAWPISNILIEIALWFVLIIPWLIYRTMCNPGLGNLRPDVPLDEMPGCIRLDMFFMDFADTRRLGFSDSQWRLLTGTGKPFFASCVDESTIDRDPSMPSLRYASNWAAGAQPGSYPQVPMSPGQMQPHGQQLQQQQQQHVQQQLQQQQRMMQSSMTGDEAEGGEVHERSRRRRRDHSRRRGDRSHSRGGAETGETMEPSGFGTSPGRSVTGEDEADIQADRGRRSRSRRRGHRDGSRNARSGDFNDWDDQSGGEGGRRHSRRGRSETNNSTMNSTGFLNPQDIDRMLNEV